MTDTTVIKIGIDFEFPKTGGHLTWVSGIATEARAKAWGERLGYQTVWWLKARQRAYAIAAPVKAVETGNIIS